MPKRQRRPRWHAGLSRSCTQHAPMRFASKSRSFSIKLVPGLFNCHSPYTFLHSFLERDKVSCIVMLSSMRTFNTYQQPAADTLSPESGLSGRCSPRSLIHVAVLCGLPRPRSWRHFRPIPRRLVPQNFALGRVDDPDPKPLVYRRTGKEGCCTTKQHAASRAEHRDPERKPDRGHQTRRTWSIRRPRRGIVKPIATDNPKVSDADLKNLTKMQQKRVHRHSIRDLKRGERAIHQGQDLRPTSKSAFEFRRPASRPAPGGRPAAESPQSPA